MNAAQIETLLDRLEAVSDVEARELTRSLVAELLRAQSEVFARLVEQTRRTPGGGELLAGWAEDPLIAGLLLLHGLHPDSLSIRLDRVMAQLKPVCEFVGVALHLVYTVSTCVVEMNALAEVPPHALDDLQRQIESAIVGAAPEIESVQFTLSRRVALPVFLRAAP